MYCIYCGQEIKNDSQFCKHCGKKIMEEPVQIQEQAQPEQESNKLLWLKVLIPVIAILLTGALILGISPLFVPDATPSFSETPQTTPTPTATPAPTLSPQDLREQLSKSWSKAEHVGGYTFNYELKFSSDGVSCNYYYLEKLYGLTGFDYEIISGNQIQRHYPDKVYTITFNEEKTVMTISPAISNAEKSENWYLNGFLETEEKKDALSDALLNNWTRTGFSKGYYYTYELDFSEDGARYHFSDDTNYSSGGGNLDYKIISDNQIKFIGSDIIYTITFDDTQETMTMSPAFSGTAESEIWYLKSLRLTDDIQQILWQRREVSNSSFAMYDLYFYDTQAECFVTQANQQNYYSFDYEIISNNQIQNKVSGIIHTITLNKAKNIMIISPAISSTAESETWYYLEE